MSEDSAEGDAVKESCWSDAIELGQKLGATADLLATHELVNKIVANKGDGEYAVKTAKWLQNQHLLDRRLFVSLLLKVGHFFAAGVCMEGGIMFFFDCSISARYLWKWSVI